MVLVLVLKRGSKLCKNIKQQKVYRNLIRRFSTHNTAAKPQSLLNFKPVETSNTPEDNVSTSGSNIRIRRLSIPPKESLPIDSNKYEILTYIIEGELIEHNIDKDRDGKPLYSGDLLYMNNSKKLNKIAINPNEYKNTSVIQISIPNESSSDLAKSKIFNTDMDERINNICQIVCGSSSNLLDCETSSLLNVLNHDINIYVSELDNNNSNTRQYFDINNNKQIFLLCLKGKLDVSNVDNKIQSINTNDSSNEFLRILKNRLMNDQNNEENNPYYQDDDQIMIFNHDLNGKSSLITKNSDRILDRVNGTHTIEFNHSTEENDKDSKRKEMKEYAKYLVDNTDRFGDRLSSDTLNENDHKSPFELLAQSLLGNSNDLKPQLPQNIVLSESQMVQIWGTSCIRIDSINNKASNYSTATSKSKLPELTKKQKLADPYAKNPSIPLTLRQRITMGGNKNSSRIIQEIKTNKVERLNKSHGHFMIIELPRKNDS